MQFQTPLPERFNRMDMKEMASRVSSLRSEFGNRLVILCHHYQKDEVFEFADYTGDSYKLSQLASEREEAETIVFCGVHFMAESADILKKGDQRVILPDLGAGCSMADMADIDQVEECWETLANLVDPLDILPITYMNSSAAIKALCGREGGAVCTSSNAETVFQWAFDQGKRILFLPDEHLGRNVGWEMGVRLDEMPVYDPHQEFGGCAADELRDAKVILWKGHCSVHGRFLPEHVDRMRETYPGIRVIVHPECRYEVVQKADDWGSTEKIIREVTASPPGSKWAVGTEQHLVDRLAAQNSDKEVYSLSGFVCQCATMYRIDLPHLLWVLENLAEGEVKNQITVPPDEAEWARVALRRMLDSSPAGAGLSLSRVD
ncbi:MAG: quinolinate synthase NadA [Planctomycetota bacterium]|nr:quinolinate synthase NadA [Planctomycetota bacterium]